MTEFFRTKPRGVHERIYHALLRLYPRDFRQEFGDAMTEFFHDRLARTRAAHPIAGPFRLWPHVLIDFARNALPARLDSTLRAVRRSRQRVVAGRTPTIRDSRRKDWMLTTILQDMRYAARGLTSKPAFSAIVLATLTLGIGATVAIFSVINGILLRPLPYAEPRRLMLIEQVDPYGTVSEPEFADYKRQARSLERVAAIAYSSANLTGGDDEPERVRLARVSDGFFQILGVATQLGRYFTSDEDKPNATTVIILSYRLWQRRYGADSTIIGKDVVVNGNPRMVVGVMPQRFDYPSSSIDMWVPLRLNYDSLWTRDNHYLSVIARRAPNVTFPSSVAELNAITRTWTREYPDTYAPDKPVQVKAAEFEDALVGKSKPYLYALLGAVAFVLLIACVNVANLLPASSQVAREST